MESMQNVDGTKGNMYCIAPKVISKEQLDGTLDSTTLEWTDGVFTSILRKILDNQKGELELRHWSIFDGDVDPGMCLLKCDPFSCYLTDNDT
jgi:dynein heavy chain 1, cytosolic